MSPSLLQILNGPALPDHCEPASEFLRLVSSTLHICIPSPLALVSSILGVLSIVSWLFAQLPQIYKNYKLQSTAGLSAFFLIEWCLGDSTNLVGALFTRQASWQVTIASYYVFVDVVLVFQYFWYTYCKGSRKGKDGLERGGYDGENGRVVVEGISPFENGSIQESSPDHSIPSEPKDMLARKGPSFDSPQFHSPSYASTEKFNVPRARHQGATGSSLPMVSPKTILLTSMLCAMLANASPVPQETSIAGTSFHEPSIETAGRILSWMSTILYLGSRLPQLYKNYLRRSTSGLSPLLFMAAFSGNFFYSTSLLTNPNAWFDFPAYGGGGWVDGDGNDRQEWIALATPFFLGAAGVLSLDAFMGVQFLIYGERGGDLLIRVEDARDPGHSHWRRVTGWMRGWIPSLDPREAEEDEEGEDRALLSTMTERGNGYGTV
jgi:uncharacterized protein with PQ loop repeat